MFPKNAWYVACSSDEVTDKPLGRTVCNERLVFYRDAEGKVAALEDFCPHRGAPLSLGRVVEGKLVCGYHGLEMGCDGKTIAMPGQRVRGFPAIRTFPLIERYGFIWIWPGDATQADAAKLHHLEWAESDEWAYGGGLYHIHCDYRLMVDNLMDLTHETYVHASSIGQKEIDETPTTTRVEGDEVITSRMMENISAPPFWRMALRGNGLADDVPVDRWQICRFTPPSHVMIEVGVAHAGKGGYHADAAHKASSIVVDFITPETDTSIWYFWGMARNFRPEDKELTESIREGQGQIFSEDLEMLEQQQRNLLAHPTRALLKLNIDAGGVQSRRVIERILAQEQQPASAPPVTALTRFWKITMTDTSELHVRVARKTVEALDISSFELVRTDGQPLPAFSAGSHVDVHLPSGITRQYSLCNDAGESHRYLIGVLRDPASRGGSRAMHDEVNKGDVLRISTPKNHFELSHAATHSLLLAGGIGVTPILCMAERLAVTGKSFEMHYCTRSADRTAFRQRIADAAFAPQVQFHFDDGAADQKLVLEGVIGKIQPGTHLYVCGPKGFMDWVLGSARATGWPEAQLHYEFFGADVAPSADDSSFDVKLASSGRVIRIPADRTVVQALGDAGVEVQVSCEQGVCGTCLTRVLEGEPDHKDMYLTPEEQAANDQFTPCCSRARSPMLVLDL